MSAKAFTEDEVAAVATTVELLCLAPAATALLNPMQVATSRAVQRDGRLSVALTFTDGRSLRLTLGHFYAPEDET